MASPAKIIYTPLPLWLFSSPTTPTSTPNLHLFCKLSLLRVDEYLHKQIWNENVYTGSLWRNNISIHTELSCAKLKLSSYNFGFRIILVDHQDSRDLVSNYLLYLKCYNHLQEEVPLGQNHVNSAFSGLFFNRYLQNISVFILNKMWMHFDKLIETSTMWLRHCDKLNVNNEMW